MDNCALGEGEFGQKQESLINTAAMQIAYFRLRMKSNWGKDDIQFVEKQVKLS